MNGMNMMLNALGVDANSIMEIASTIKGSIEEYNRKLDIVIANQEQIKSQLLSIEYRQTLLEKSSEKV